MQQGSARVRVFITEFSLLRVRNPLENTLRGDALAKFPEDKHEQTVAIFPFI